MPAAEYARVRPAFATLALLATAAACLLHAHVAAAAPPPPPAVPWSVEPGALPSGYDAMPPRNVTTAEAEQLCANWTTCGGFTFQGPKKASALPVKTFFKQVGGDPNTGDGWSYSKPGGAASTPFSYHGCTTPATGQGRAWCDFTLPHAQRVGKLLALLTLEEKISLLSPNGTIAHNTCNCHTRGAPRVGLGKYMWLDETNTGASAGCLGPGHCVTTFPGPLGVAASFNRSLWKAKGGVIGTEVRALNNVGWWRDAGGTVSEKIGLTGHVEQKKAAKTKRKARGGDFLDSVGLSARTEDPHGRVSHVQMSKRNRIGRR